MKALSQIELCSDAGQIMFECASRESVLDAATRSCLPSPIPAGCRRGGCGLCRILIEDGDFAASCMSARHISPVELARGETLACRTFARGNLRIRPIPPKRYASTYADERPIC